MIPLRVVCGFLCAGLLWTGCMIGAADSPSGASPQHPPVPTTPSILPLNRGNAWTYSFTAYDTDGRPVKALSRMELSLSIPRAYAILGDTQLVEITWENYDDGFTSFAYPYVWEDADSGVLVSHRGDGPVQGRGLYVVGAYLRGACTLRDTPYLWLPYPVVGDTTWELPGDSVKTVMTVVGTEEQFYYAFEGAERTSPLEFRKCYLFSETRADTTTFYYYHPDIGALGYRRYEGRTLRVSTLLTRFTLRG